VANDRLEKAVRPARFICKTIKAFAYRVTGNQRYKQEYEVLIQSGLQLAQYDYFEASGITVRAYDVYLALHRKGDGLDQGHA
jgi:hypothetical protein